AALMLAEAPCDRGAPLHAPPCPRPQAEKKLFNSGRRARLMSRICLTSVARFSASCHMVKVSSLILRYTQEGMPLRYLSRSSRSPYLEWSAGPLNNVENSAALHLCSGGIVEIAKASLKRCKEGCFVGEGGCCSLDPSLDSSKLEEDGGGPGLHITIEETEGDLNFKFDGRERRVDCPGAWVRTLLATRGTKACLRAKTAVVTVRRANFDWSECASSLAAATAVEATEEVWWRGDIRQGLEARRGLLTTSWPKNATECLGARPWEVFPTAAPRRAGGSLEGSL
ncbi:hypothetical protein POSPLADRAFT_1163409, partial [Postia placenta MAD-698-R-SB12]